MGNREWVFYAGLLSFVAVFFAEANRHFKMEGHRLNFWSLVVSLIILIPVSLLIKWPAPSVFYPAAILAGTVMAVSTAVRLTLSANKLGRVSTLYLPVEAIFSFVLWFFMDAIFRNNLLSSPVDLSLIIVAFSLVTLSLAMMRQNDVCWDTFLIVAPLGFLHGLSGVFSKYVVPPEATMETIMAFIVCLYIFSVVSSACFLGLRGKKGKKGPLLPPGMMKAAVAFGVVGLMGRIFFLQAIKVAPNPGYVVAIAMLAPVWIMIYHKAFKLKDDANPLAGIVMVMAAMLLVLSS